MVPLPGCQRCRGIGIMTVLLVFTLNVRTVRSQLAYESPPIDYFRAPCDDPVQRLQTRIDRGEVQLEFDPRTGYLKSVLQQLQVTQESQVLVYSKTSFQLRHISPATPRAIYFGDDVYVGWVQDGDVMEVSAVDPQLGANFYTLPQRKMDRPKFQRRTHDCLQCHGSLMTRGVPGHMIRSVYTAPDGQPLLEHPSMLTDARSPLGERWGGWYVTGSHGSQRHLGNLVVRRADPVSQLNLDQGANVLDLKQRLDTGPYLTPHSDIVALMVLEHQATMHNVLTAANFQVRHALRDQETLNRMLERPLDYPTETLAVRLEAAAEPVVEHLLFVGEARLTEPIRGTSKFTESFVATGPCDDQGRTLRALDLQTRLFRYPCSYLIYSQAFDGLPLILKQRIYQRLHDILAPVNPPEEYSHLSDDDRNAIRCVLRQTKVDLPPDWHEG